jgi:hypothetical protein
MKLYDTTYWMSPASGVPTQGGRGAHIRKSFSLSSTRAEVLDFLRKSVVEVGICSKYSWKHFWR